MSHVHAALDAFIARYLERFPDLRQRHDPQWLSPCTIGSMDSSDLIAWRPVARRVSFAEQDVLAPLARAFDMKIHEDICTYFSAYWSGGLEATCEFGAVSLLLLWNEEDAVRLIENQIGHVLAQRRARAPLTVFFACGATDTDDIYSVDNHSGCVMLEQPGRKPLRDVAPDLAAFLNMLEPAPPPA